MGFQAFCQSCFPECISNLASFNFQPIDNEPFKKTLNSRRTKLSSGCESVSTWSLKLRKQISQSHLFILHFVSAVAWSHWIALLQIPLKWVHRYENEDCLRLF